MTAVKVTLSDVARKAGVSASAVSRVFTPGASASKKTVVPGMMVKVIPSGTTTLPVTRYAGPHGAKVVFRDNTPTSNRVGATCVELLT